MKLLALCIVFLAGLTAFVTFGWRGQSIQDMEIYTRDVGNPTSHFEQRTGDTLAYALIKPTQEIISDPNLCPGDEMCVLWMAQDSLRVISGPYELTLVFLQYAETGDSVKLDSVEVQIGDGRPVELVYGQVEVPFGAWEPSLQTGTMAFDLNGVLAFSETDDVVVTVVYRTPDEDAAETLRTVFKPEKYIARTPKWETYFLGG